MYAIFENGNKQYKVSVGDALKVEKLNAAVGATVTFPVILTADEKGIQVGKEVEKTLVSAEVFKYKAKKNERKKQGHRQPYTCIKVTAIGEAQAEKKSAKKAAPAKENAEAVTEAPAPKKRTTKKAEPAKAAEATKAE